MTRQPLDWSKYTNFRYRKPKDELIALCSKYSRQELKEIFETPDETGLCPIHWAAIHNRSDMIAYMVDQGSSIGRRCGNKLFFEGTPLHLAALNGSIEAAAMLLAKANNVRTQQNSQYIFVEKGASHVGTRDIIEARDSEGQTPLMRTAAPRSRRMDTVRDLLRKNLWSFNSRPAETALFLICNGADWRLTDDRGLNLMHLAIVNDYDDIVSMLLVIDTSLLYVLAKLKAAQLRHRRRRADKRESGADEKRIITKKTKSPNFETVLSRESIVETKPKSSSRSRRSSSRDSLISREEKSIELISRGVTPLQLAIIYGRVDIISLLWHAEAQQRQISAQKKPTAIEDTLEAQRDAAGIRSRGSIEHKKILWRAVLTNPDELAKLLKQTLLKVALIVDIALMAVFWTPAYFSMSSWSFSVFVLSAGCTIALAIRTASRNPGFLRRDSLQYLREISDLLGDRSQNKTSTNINNTTPKSIAVGSERPKDQPLMRFTSTDAAVKKDVPTMTKETSSTSTSLPTTTKTTKATIDTYGPDWSAQLALKDRVRLLCHKCRCIRRPRSRHCNYCNHCVQDFDHHCIYLGCCISRNNRVDFFLMLVLMTFTSLYGTIVYLSSPARSTGSRFWHAIGFISIAKYLFISGWQAFFMFRRACMGVTMYENLRSKRIRKIFGSGGPPESIVKSHKMYMTSQRGSFWRYAPSRFIPNQSYKVILNNLAEFFNQNSIDEYLMTIFCNDTTLARSMNSSDSRINMYQFL